VQRSGKSQSIADDKTLKTIATILIILILVFLIISPVDFIPDPIPIIGWIDDIIYIVAILGLVMNQWR